MMKAATLAIGTEVTDGQILDRNSGWISSMLVRSGIKVIEHRVVADERGDIARSLRELLDRVDLLFVTGGLGPTSDDFTRDVLAEVFGRPLDYDEASWRHVVETLTARGIEPREYQKQQCFFPRGSEILLNSVGTANGFCFEVDSDDKSANAASNFTKKTVFALPGPPQEIAAIWGTGVALRVDSLVPDGDRDFLHIFRCLGKGEGELAELAEKLIEGSGLRVGYRAHVPYVEIKVWVQKAKASEARETLGKLDAALAEWLVNRDEEDVADVLIDAAASGRRVLIDDGVTKGFLQNRLAKRVKERALEVREIPIQVWTTMDGTRLPSTEVEAEIRLRLTLDDSANLFIVEVEEPGRGTASSRRLEVRPPYRYKVRSERGRKFITEKALHFFSTSRS